ncbi:unnamed protein product [Linum trigynum]|uniref:Uncharacterized protein n=1 Tax=Linum trigynum TaxID=586398 RepID=A0AAV2DAV2_9ROSI
MKDQLNMIVKIWSAKGKEAVSNDEETHSKNDNHFGSPKGEGSDVKILIVPPKDEHDKNNVGPLKYVNVKKEDKLERAQIETLLREK